MVADIKIKANTIEIDNYLKNIQRKFPRAIKESLARVSAFGVKQITEKTQKGQKPDGGTFRPYAQSTKRDRQERGRQISFVDLTDTGRMFRSLTFKTRSFSSSLFFRRSEENRKAAFHDFYGAGKGKVVRRFFAIGRKDEEKIRQLFFKHLVKKTGIR